MEFSDKFSYEILEYQWDYIRDSDGLIVQPERVWWKVWLFQYDSEQDKDKILTLYTVVRPKTREIVRYIEEIPARPSNYIVPKLETIMASTLTNEMIQRRNWQNDPYVFSVNTGTQAYIEHIIPQNYYQAGWLEFLITPTVSGAVVEIWNYSPQEQNFELILQGRQIIESRQQRKNTLTIPHFISEDGIIEQKKSLCLLHPANPWLKICSKTYVAMPYRYKEKQV